MNFRAIDPIINNHKQNILWNDINSADNSVVMSGDATQSLNVVANQIIQEMNANLTLENQLSLMDNDVISHKLDSYQEQINNILLSKLTPNELNNFNTAKLECKNCFHGLSNELHAHNLVEVKRLAYNLQTSLQEQSTQNVRSTNDSDRVSGIADSGASFFALLISVMLFGYNTTAEYGKLMLLKQKDAQSVASAITELQKFLLELKDLTSHSKSDKDTLYSFFYAAFGLTDKDSGWLNPEYNGVSGKDANAVLGKYVDLLRGVKTSSGLGFDDVKWSMDHGTKNKDAEDLLSEVLNCLLESINKKMQQQGIGSGSYITEFQTKDGSGCISKEVIFLDEVFKKGIESQQKSCEGCSSQLTTINQNIQASVSQATESVKSLLEWLKQSITGYGTSISQR